MGADAYLYSQLTTHTGVSALIGTRCYPMKLPQAPTFPAIVYQQISGGSNQGSSELHEDRYQLSCWAETYTGARALSDQVEDALEEHSNAATSPYLVMAYRIGKTDDYDEQDRLYRVILDFYLHMIG